MPTLGIAKPAATSVQQVNPPEDGPANSNTNDNANGNDTNNNDSNSNNSNNNKNSAQQDTQQAPPLPPPPVASSGSLPSSDAGEGRGPTSSEGLTSGPPNLGSEVSRIMSAETEGDGDVEEGDLGREGKPKSTITSGVTSATRGDAGRSSASISEATSPARATSSASHLWQRLRRLNRGCAEAYIAPPSDSGPRIKHFKGSAKPPGEQLEAGLMVRYFHTDRRCFEHRILKTDKRRSFLYLLKHADSNTDMDPVVIRCLRITQVLGGEEGLAAFYSNSVRDPALEGYYLNASTAVMISCAEPGETPSPGDLTFLVAPPQTKLKWLLTALMVEASSQKMLDAEESSSRGMTPTSSVGGGNLPSKAASVTDGGAPSSLWWRLEGCRVQNLSTVLREMGGHAGAEHDFGAELELRLRSLDESRRAGHRVHYVKYKIPSELAYCRPEAIAGTCKKVFLGMQDQFGGFTAVDSVRLQMALLEVALFHRWGQTAGQHFGGDLFRYLTQPPDISRESPFPLERDMINEAIPDHPLKMEQLETYCRPALKSTVSAMVQLLDLEDNYFAVQNGRLYKLNTLAGADTDHDLMNSPETMQEHDDFAQQAASFLEKLQSVTSPSASPTTTRRSAARSTLRNGEGHRTMQPRLRR